MPTLLDLAGVEIPKGIDGRSFKKQILESNLWYAKIVRNSLNYNANTYFDNSKILNNRLIEYDVSEKPSSKKELYDIIAHHSNKTY